MDDKWEKVRQIVREECERIELRIVSTLTKNIKSKVGFKNGQFTGIGEIELAALEAAYPAVDVRKNLKEAAAWICMNPGEAPVSNYGKFINSWLGRHQNRASLHAIPIAKESPAAHKLKHCEYCPKVATGAPGGIWACAEHFNDALDRKPRGHMWGVMAKPVAGNDG